MFGTAFMALMPVVMLYLLLSLVAGVEGYPRIRKAILEICGSRRVCDHFGQMNACPHTAIGL